MISQSKGNHTMKSGQLVEYNKNITFFFKNRTENEAGRLLLNLFLFFEKALYDVKSSGLQLNFNIF